MDIKQAIIIVLSGFVGSIGFSLLFRMNKQKIIFAAIGGGLTCLVYVVAFNFSEKSFFQNLFPALFATAYSEILARLTKSPSTPYIAISIIPLVPGSKLYYTMYYLITDNDLAFKEYFLETLRIAGGLGVGIIRVSVIIREINYHKFKPIYDME